MPNINIKLSKEELEFLRKLKGQLTWKEFFVLPHSKRRSMAHNSDTMAQKQIKKLKQKENEEEL